MFKSKVAFTRTTIVTASFIIVLLFLCQSSLISFGNVNNSAVENSGTITSQTPALISNGIGNYASASKDVIKPLSNIGATEVNSSFKLLNLSYILNRYLVWVSQVDFSDNNFAIAGGNGLVLLNESGNVTFNYAVTGSSGFASYVSGYNDGFIVGGNNYLNIGGLYIYNYSIVKGEYSVMSSLLPISWTSSNPRAVQYMASFSIGGGDMMIVDEVTNNSRISVGVIENGVFVNITSSLPVLKGPIETSYGDGNFLLLSSNAGVLFNVTSNDVFNTGMRLSGQSVENQNSMITWNGSAFIIASGASLMAYNPSNRETSEIYTANSGAISFVKYSNDVLLFGVYNSDNTTVFKMINDTTFSLIALNGQINDASVSSENLTYVFIGNMLSSLHSLLYIYSNGQFLYNPTPASVQYQSYTAISIGQTLRFNLTNLGPAGVSFGVMNSTLNLSIYNADSLAYSTTIRGAPTNYSVVLGGDAYCYHNFNISPGAYIVVKNVGSSSGLFAFNCYDYYISNNTASLIMYPAQFGLSIVPNDIPRGQMTGISTIIQVPDYQQPIPLAILTNGGGNSWFAQIGLDTAAFQYGSSLLSYPVLEIFSSVYGNVGPVVDYNYPLAPGSLCNFTLEVVKNSTWEFKVDGQPIQYGGFSGYYNATPTMNNVHYGLETEPYLWAEVNSSNEVYVPTMFNLKIDGVWTEPGSATFSPSVNSIGENWYNGETTSSDGISIWGMASHIQNDSIGNNSLLFGDRLSTTVESAVPISGVYQDPLYGTFYVSPGNYGNHSAYLKVENKTLAIAAGDASEIVSLISYSSPSGRVIQDSNYILRPHQNLTFSDNSTYLLVAASDLNHNLIYEYIVNETPRRYNVTFSESGLPSGASWYINISDLPSLSSSSTTISTSLTNSSYTFTIASGNKIWKPSIYSGQFTVNGAPFTEKISFTEVTSSVTFTESGVPMGIKWSVDFNGTNESSTNQSITFLAINGTYQFSMGHANSDIYEYDPSPSSGSVIVNGSEISVSITFARVGPIKYNVVFNEIGLPSGYPWSFTFNGTNYTDPYDAWGFNVPNGTYYYSVDNVSGYTDTNSSGRIVVNGNDEYVNVYFTKIPDGYFIGNISPNNASVYINGVQYATNNGNFNISLNPGTYEVKISDPGYSTYIANITISSSFLTELPIQSLTKVSKHPSSDYWFIVLIGAIFIAIIATVVVVITTRTRRKKT